MPKCEHGIGTRECLVCVSPESGDMGKTIAISAIHLFSEGPDKYSVVCIEHDGEWYEVCRETNGGPFSHIVEVGGMLKSIVKK